MIKVFKIKILQTLPALLIRVLYASCVLTNGAFSHSFRSSEPRLGLVLILRMQSGWADAPFCSFQIFFSQAQRWGAPRRRWYAAREPRPHCTSQYGSCGCWPALAPLAFPVSSPPVPIRALAPEKNNSKKTQKKLKKSAPTQYFAGV